MKEKNLKVLIGMSWPYANGKLHIGHIASELVSDVIARYWRDQGADVSFVSGGDCFGTPILVAAKQDGVEPAEIAEKYHGLQSQDFADLLFTHDNYTKTLSPHHIKFVQDFHAEMYAGENISVENVQQLYCEDCKQYLPDRYVEGLCPHCGCRAKGDSCDHCGKILEPEELKDPKCKLCGGTPKMKDTKQIYLKLSGLQEKIQKNAAAKNETWTKNAVGMTEKYLTEGLRDRAITRNISWGVSLPKSAETLLGNLDDKKIYIWAENVLGYFSATKEVKKNWREFLLDDVKSEKLHYYVHAKDNIPFHSIILPGLLLANSGHKWHLPDRIVASEYITLNGKKISKSDGNYITARELIDKFDVDYLRYYFLRNINDKKDANFSYTDFINTINGELVDNFGNLVNRTLTFIVGKFVGKIPKNALRNETAQAIKHTQEEVCQNIEFGYCNKGLAVIMDLVSFGNKHFNDDAPWRTIKDEAEKSKQTISECVEIVKTACGLLKYYIPKSAEKVLDWLRGDKLPEIEILYKKLEEENV